MKKSGVTKAKKTYTKPEVRQIKRVVACGGHKV